MRIVHSQGPVIIQHGEAGSCCRDRDSALLPFNRFIMLLELFPAAPYTVGPHLLGWCPAVWCGAAGGASTGTPPCAVSGETAGYTCPVPRLNDSALNTISALKLMLAHGQVHHARRFCASCAEAMRGELAKAFPECDRETDAGAEAIPLFCQQRA